MIFDTALLAQVESRESQRFAYVHEQGFDRSCGYASVASLLDLYWNLPVLEPDLLARQGLAAATGDLPPLSLATVGKILAEMGFTTHGYRLTWDQLAKRAPKSAPLLVHYDRPQKHFALVLDVEAERVITADPARGIEVLSREEFEARWSGVALFVTHPSATLNRKRLDEARSSSLARADLLETRARSP